MKIIIGKTVGFCYGVKRAVDGSIEQLKDKKSKEIYCLGELINNKQVIEELEKKGIKFINNINEIKDKNSRLIIRAHGIEQNIYDVAKSKGIELIDYTCPNVKRIHKIAKEYQKQGYYIFLIGVEGHPEVIGNKSYCGKNFSLISVEGEVEKAIKDFEKSNIKKLLLISQTTYSIKKFDRIKRMIEQRINKEVDLVIKNTICLSTEQRQKETKELSTKVDMNIIVGGKNSSNTKKLYDIAKEKCENTIHIETKAELEKIEFRNIEEIGIMAGASTPQNSIYEVIEFLKTKDINYTHVIKL